MKLRLRGNSARIRLTQTEVHNLEAQGAWEETTVFGPTAMHRFVYRVESRDVSRPAIKMFSAGAETVVTATLPREEVTRWARGGDVGIYFEEPWGMKVAIEKDFRCLDEKRDEDESDNFENPNATGSLHAACQSD